MVKGAAQADSDSKHHSGSSASMLYQDWSVKYPTIAAIATPRYVPTA